ncbi:MAG: methyltransferase domain-containing protein [Fermentimonas sp.]|nr:methyltransferase domain-containing protein [Fermentimonas sp.]
MKRLSDGSLLIDKVISRFKEVRNLNDIVLAVPDVPENVVFDEIAKKHDIACFKGDKDDIGKRLLYCARENKANIIVRIFGHDVAINPLQLEEMLKEVIAKGVEGAVFNNEVFHGGGFILNIKTLARLQDLLSKPEVRREFAARPDSYIRLNPDKFDIIFVEAKLPSEDEIEAARKYLRETLCQDGVTDVDIKYADDRDHSITKYKLAIDYLHAQHNVLDVACAYGVGTNLLAEHCQTITGVDLSESAIKQARDNIKRDNVSFLLGDATALDFISDNMFDRVVSFDTIEHIEQDRAFIKEIKRVLKPEGLFILGTPRKVGEHVINPYHVREYSYEELEALLLEEGLRIIKQYSHTGYIISEQDATGEGFIWVCQKWGERRTY